MFLKACLPTFKSKLKLFVFFTKFKLFFACLHLIEKRLSSEFLHIQTAMHHGCNEFLNSIAGTYYETATFVY